MPRRNPLSREDVLRAAVDILDDEGPDALTMRRLAERLRTKPTTLYGRVTSKDDVLDGVYGLLLRAVELPPLEAEWRDWIRSAWSSYRRALLAHPRALLACVRWQGGRGSEQSALTNSALGVFENAGFTTDQALHAYRALSAFTIGIAFTEASASEREPADQRTLGVPEGDAGPFTRALPGILAPDFDATFQLGLEAMVNGLADVADRSPRTRPAPRRRRS